MKTKEILEMTDVKKLERLARSSNPYIRELVGKNPNASVESLLQLANDVHEDVRCAAVKTISKLPWGCRYEAAESKMASVELLKKLSLDKEGLVREAVARNNKTPEPVLVRLAQDVNSIVCCCAIQSNKISTEILSELANDGDWHIRYEVARHKNALRTILAKLSRDKEALVRAAVAENKNTSIDILANLTADKVKWVKEIAQDAMKRREKA